MIKENLIRLIDWYGSTDRKRFSEFAEKTGVGRESLKQFYHGKQKLNNEHLDLIVQAFPDFAYWLVSSKTIPEAGQIAPIGEDEGVGLRDAIVSILDAKDMEGVLLTPDQTADLILERLSKQGNVTASEDTEAV